MAPLAALRLRLENRRMMDDAAGPARRTNRLSQGSWVSITPMLKMTISPFWT